MIKLCRTCYVSSHALKSHSLALLGHQGAWIKEGHHYTLRCFIVFNCGDLLSWDKFLPYYYLRDQSHSNCEIASWISISDNLLLPYNHTSESCDPKVCSVVYQFQ